MKKLKLSWNACKNLMKTASIIAFSGIVLIGCKKEMTKIDNTKTNSSIVSTAKINDAIKTENGVMVFTSQEDFNTELMNTYKITNADRIVWEKSHNFKSLHTIYNEICKAEFETCLKPYENVSEEEAQKITTPEHTAIFYEAVNNGIVKVVKNNDGSVSQALNCSQMNFAPFLSADGIVAINNDLYQYKDGKAKQFKNAQPTMANIEKIKTVTVSNETEGISVFNVNEKSRATGNEYFGQPQTYSNGTFPPGGGLYTPPGNNLYRVVFDFNYNFTWDGIAINRASTYYFNSYLTLKTMKKKNSAASTYYPYTGDHYIQSNTTPFANMGGTFKSLLVDVNGNPIYSNGTTQAAYNTSINHIIYANDAGQGNAEFHPSLSGMLLYVAPNLPTAPPVLGYVQSYFATNPTAYMKWNFSGMVPGGNSGFPVYNVKN